MSTEFIAYPGQGYAVSQEPGLPQQAESPWAPPQHGHSSMLCRQPLDAVRRCWDVCCERPVLVPKGAVVGHSSPWCPLSSFKLDTFWTNRGCGDHQQITWVSNSGLIKSLTDLTLSALRGLSLSPGVAAQWPASRRNRHRGNFTSLPFTATSYLWWPLIL